MTQSLKTVFEQFDLEEDNTTSNIEPLDTPFAFRKKERKTFDDEVYSDKVHSTERFFKKIDEVISEISYSDFKSDGTKNEKQKINDNIISMNRKLREVEQMINHASKLKNETGKDQTVFWKGTLNSFIKIKERLNRLTTKLIEITG